MRIKRFEAKDTKSAMALMKSELGEDAVILATRSIPADEKGGKSRIEVVAAMDYDLDEIEAAVSSAAPSSTAQAAYGYHAVRSIPPAEKKGKGSSKPAAIDKGATEQPHLEAHDMRLKFANLVRQGSPDKPTAVKYRPEAISPPRSTPSTKQSDPAAVRQWRDQIIEKIQTTSQDGDSSRGAMLVALVGATGVGKTTTAAKLAAWSTLRQGLRVALLSMDCYRIGATDQLRTYAQIMRLPCEIVLRQQDLAKALARHRDKDIIIIDTAGKSPYDEAHIQELQSWFASCPAIEPHLVLSATTKKEDLKAIISSYSALSARSLILTKLDETRAYAALCQQVVASSLPVSYLSTGQRVPEDFLVASKDYMDILFKRGWNAAASYMAARSQQ